MRATKLPYEVEALLRKDFHAVSKHIEEILLGGKPNRAVMNTNYLTPRTEDAAVVSKTDPNGELHHFRKVRSVIEYIFEHEGTIREKYRQMLQDIHAPSYIMALIT